MNITKWEEERTSRDRQACIKASWHGTYCSWVQAETVIKTICSKQREGCHFYRDVEKAGDIRWEDLNEHVLSKFAGSLASQWTEYFEESDVNFWVSPDVPRTYKIPCPI